MPYSDSQRKSDYGITLARGLGVALLPGKGMAQTRLQEIQEKAESILHSEGVPANEIKKHGFYLFVTGLEKKSRMARWVYPLAYLALGIAFLVCVYIFSGVKTADMWKLIGAVAAVFSALLAFWKPGVTLTQDDAVSHLPGNKRMTSADLQDFNRILALPSKKTEDVFKLAGAVASFFAVYVLLG